MAGALALVIGCSASPDSNKTSSGAKSKQDPAAQDDGTTTDPSTTPGNGPSGDPVTVEAEVFAHSKSTLFRLDPLTRALTKVADFSGCDGDVIDLAVNATGDVYVTTWTQLAKVDKKTARCTKIADGSFPNSLAFVPVGTLDAKSEVLVGYDVDEYIRIDPKTGAITKVGSLNAGRTGKTYRSSGDIVAIEGKTYLTVKEQPSTEPNAPDPSPNDYLVSVDPKTGKITQVIGSTNQADLWGVGYWAGTLYAFSNGGGVFAIDPKTAIATPMTSTAATQGQSFWGAGVTTSAPLVPGN